MSQQTIARGYAADWIAISLSVRRRCGGRCECEGECGLHRERRCCEQNGEPAIFARGMIVLTVAHLDHNPGNNASDNLKAMCQRCHLLYDLDLHMLHRIRNQGLIDIPEEELRKLAIQQHEERVDGYRSQLKLDPPA